MITIDASVRTETDADISSHDGRQFRYPVTDVDDPTPRWGDFERSLKLAGGDRWDEGHSGLTGMFCQPVVALPRSARSTALGSATSSGFDDCPPARILNFLS
jgi:hypothetical protein